MKISMPQALCALPLVGGVAQLGERLPCTQEVIGSNPFTSTRINTTVVDQVGGLLDKSVALRFESNNISYIFLMVKPPIVYVF